MKKYIIPFLLMVGFSTTCNAENEFKYEITCWSGGAVVFNVKTNYLSYDTRGGIVMIQDPKTHKRVALLGGPCVITEK